MAVKTLSLVLLCLSLWLSGAFLPPIAQSQSIGNSFLAPTFLPQRKLASASANDGLAAKNEAPAATSVEDRKNAAYVDSLLENLTTLLDKWILTGSAATKQGAYNILEQIQLHARDPEQLELAKRRVQRAGLPFQQKEIAQKSNPNKELGRTDDERRRQDAEHRKNWEYSRTADTGKDVTSNLKSRSALSQRGTGEPDLLMGQFDFDLRSQQQFANDKVALQNQLDGRIEGETALYDYLRNELDRAASNKVSELVARAGTKSSFEGQNLGIGGLDDVLAQVKRRVWTPLAAPPELLSELGISPVRGLLLYGKPGCGKTLLARKLGQILSPIR